MNQIPKVKQSNKKFYNKWLYKSTFKLKGISILRTYGLEKALSVLDDPDRLKYSSVRDAANSREDFVNIINFLKNSKVPYAKRIESSLVDFYTNDKNFFEELNLLLEHRLISKYYPISNKIENDIGNNVFVKNVSAGSTSTTDVVPAMYTNYTYTVSAYAGATETSRISCGSAVQATVGTPTLSSSITTDWGYTNDSWNGSNLVFTNTSTSVSNAGGYRFEYNYANLGGFISYNTTTSTSVTLETPQDYDVTARVQAYVDHNGTRYYGSFSNSRRLLSGRPQIRTARTDNYSVEAWDTTERYNGVVAGSLSTTYTAQNILVDSFQFRNLTATFASQITSSTRSVVIRKPGDNITLSGTPYISNGYNTDEFTNYADTGYRIDPTGTGWFPFDSANKLTGTIRFKVRYVSQAASAASVT